MGNPPLLRDSAKPEGLAQAFLIGADFIDNSPVSLVLGDNIFFGHGLPEMLAAASARDYWRDDIRLSGARSGAIWSGLFRRTTDVPLASLKSRNMLASNWAVTGLYFYDKRRRTVCRQG